MTRLLTLIAFFSLLFATGCVPIEQEHAQGGQEISTISFDEYWYQGKAEINSYALKQARYGEIHDGNAVLVFVTEPFDKVRQVKVDNSGNSNTQSVLKLNSLKKFPTGIYDYSIMNSVFSPIAKEGYQASLKITMSSQDWCGQSFMQINRQGNEVTSRLYSYFGSEGDEVNTFQAKYFEDDLWNQIRIDPSALPTGTVNIVPGTAYCRLVHRTLQAVEAQCELISAENGINTYVIEYPAESRTLKIFFSNSFPHTIEGWEDQYSSGWGPNAKQLTTTAKLMKRELSDYWNHNQNSDLEMRKALGL